jgi:hypothetical protein
MTGIGVFDFAGKELLVRDIPEGLRVYEDGLLVD